MRTIERRLFILLAACVLPCLAPAATASKSAGTAHTVRAILINASNTKGGVDGKLEAYGAELRRNLPFDTFRFVSEGAATVPDGGRGTISFSGGHRVELQDEAGEGIRLKLFWMTGSEVVISTTLTLNPGVPGVLVRRGAKDGDVPVVLLIAR